MSASLGPIIYGDAQAVIANDLRERLRTRAEQSFPPRQPPQVGTRTPNDRDPLADPLPLVVVAQDGPGTVQQRANMRVTLRLSVWAATDDDAYDLAMLAWAFATTHAGPVVRSVLPGIAPARAADPDTGEPMAWCTVTANVSPEHV